MLDIQLQSVFGGVFQQMSPYCRECFERFGEIPVVTDDAAMIVGAVVGAVAGGIFFARTPKGAALHFPSKRFLQYLCAKGFPTVVSVSLLGMALMVAVVAIRGAQL